MAVWVGGDATAPNDPTVLANWTAPDGSALTELPVRGDTKKEISETRITNNVSDASRMIVVEGGKTLNGNNVNLGFGSGASGKIKVSGGTFNSGMLRVGFNGGTGEIEVTSGTVNVTHGGLQSHIGNAGNGTITVSGGSFSTANSTDTFWFGTGASGNGTLNVCGNGQVTLRNTYFGADDNKRSCNGRLNVSENGIINMTSLHLSFGNNNNQKGVVVQSGGKVSTSGAQTLGENGGATYTQTGGTNTADGVIYISKGKRVFVNYGIGNGELFANGGLSLGNNTSLQSNEGGQLTLNEGGIVTAKYIKRGSATNNHFARVVCNGGKLVAKENNATWLQNLEFTYKAAGVTIDTKTFNVTATGCTTFSSAAEGSAVRKVGAGKLSYSALPLVDEIAVQEGTLAITANANVTSRSANRISVASGAAFDLGGFTLAARNLAGAGAVSNGTITVAGTLAPDGAFAFGDDTAATLSGSLALDSGDTVALGAGSTLDLSSATIVLGENVTAGWTFATGPAGSITGTPALSGAQGYIVEVSADGSSAKIRRKGFVTVVR